MPNTSARTDTPTPRIRLAVVSNSRMPAFRGRNIGLAVVSAGVAVTGASLWVVMRGNDPFRLLFPPLTRWAIRRALPGRSRSRQNPAGGRFISADVDRVVARAWQHFDARVHGIPAQPTVGGQLVLRLASWTAGLFHSLREEGLERGDAVELAADIMWQVFQLEGRFGQVLTRIRPALKTEPRRRLPDGTIDLGFPSGSTLPLCATSSTSRECHKPMSRSPSRVPLSLLRAVYEHVSDRGTSRLGTGSSIIPDTSPMTN
jgi:hypothetical protein